MDGVLFEVRFVFLKGAYDRMRNDEGSPRWDLIIYALREKIQHTVR